MSLFLTGTDTGVGKTHTAAQLLRLAKAAGLCCAGMKPICCGDRADAELLLAAGSDGLTIDEVNPVWLRTPAAPFSAALLEDVRIDTPQIIERFTALRKQFDLVIVEGVGGWLVPIRKDYFVSDLAVEMKLPVVVVAMNRLGCLNHTMLTIRSVADHGLNCPAVVLNDHVTTPDAASATNREVLTQLTDVPILQGLDTQMSTLPPSWRALIGL